MKIDRWLLDAFRVTRASVSGIQSILIRLQMVGVWRIESIWYTMPEYRLDFTVAFYYKSPTIITNIAWSAFCTRFSRIILIKATFNGSKKHASCARTTTKRLQICAYKAKLVRRSHKCVCTCICVLFAIYVKKKNSRPCTAVVCSALRSNAPQQNTVFGPAGGGGGTWAPARRIDRGRQPPPPRVDGQRRLVGDTCVTSVARDEFSRQVTLLFSRKPERLA